MLVTDNGVLIASLTAGVAGCGAGETAGERVAKGVRTAQRGEVPRSATGRE